MDNEFAPDLITLIDDEDKERSFEILGEIENDNGRFMALYPIFDSPEEQVEADGEYYIFEVIEEDGEEQLAEIEDDDLLDALAEEFEAGFDDMYDEAEDGDTTTEE